MACKIFNIGFGKSGTTSLTRAMGILGFRCVHYNHYGKKVYDIIQENKANNRKLLHGIDDYEFFSDFKGTEFYRELDKQYPNSKFILTIREMDSWLKSVEKHVKRNQRNPNYKGGWLAVDKNSLKKFRAQTTSELKEYFKRRPCDFLVMDIVGGDGWKKLCNFFSKPIPSEPFPFLNKSPCSFRRILSYLKQEFILQP